MTKKHYSLLTLLLLLPLMAKVSFAQAQMLPVAEHKPIKANLSANKLPNIILTFDEKKKTVRIGTGGVKGTSFDIDYGDGVLNHFEGAKNIDFSPKGDVKIYGNDIVVLQVIEQGLKAVTFNSNPKLSKLILQGNKLEQIDLSKLPLLTGLYLEKNSIKGELNLSAQTNLNVLSLYQNKFSGKLDLTRFTSLTKVIIDGNQFSELLLPATDKLTEIDCGDNNLTALNVSGLVNLTDLSCDANKLTVLDLSHNPNLEKLYCPENLLTQINLENNPKLKTLTVFSNKLDCITLTNNPLIEALYLQGNNLSSIDLSKNTNIRWMNLSANKLKNVALEALKQLTLLNIAQNKLSAIDLSSNLAIQTLDVSNNELNELTLAKLGNLVWLKCGNNDLEELDIQQNTYLSWLECENNKLKQLELNTQKNLQKLIANNNELVAICLVNKANLQGVQLANNKLTTAILTKLVADLPDVNTIEIHDNNREWAKLLDVSMNPGTKELDITPATKKGWMVKNKTAVAFIEPSNGNAFYVSKQKLLLIPEGNKHVTVYSLAGSIVYEQVVQSCSVDLSQLAEGHYVAIVKYSNGNIERILF